MGWGNKLLGSTFFAGLAFFTFQNHEMNRKLDASKLSLPNNWQEQFDSAHAQFRDLRNDYASRTGDTSSTRLLRWRNSEGGSVWITYGPGAAVTYYNESSFSQPNNREGICILYGDDSLHLTILGNLADRRVVEARSSLENRNALWMKWVEETRTHSNANSYENLYIRAVIGAGEKIRAARAGLDSIVVR